MSNGPFPDNMVRDAMLFCGGVGVVVGLAIAGIVWAVSR